VSSESHEIPSIYMLLAYSTNVSACLAIIGAIRGFIIRDFSLGEGSQAAEGRRAIRLIVEVLVFLRLLG
jgi:hypothetical protein